MGLTKKQQQEMNKSISRLMKYIDNDEAWDASLIQLTEDTLTDLAEYFDLTPNALLDILEQQGLHQMLNNFVIEQFLVEEFNANDQSPLDTFLKQRGWREKPIGKQYLKAMNEAELNIWEVTKLNPGKSMDVRLLGSEDKSIRIYEKSASQMVTQWSCLVARVVPVYNMHLLTGGVIPLDQEQGFALLEEIKQRRLEAPGPSAESVKKLGLDLNDEELQNLRAELHAEDKNHVLFFGALTEWLSSLFQSLSERVQLHNKEGDEFIFCNVRFPINQDYYDEIVQRLETLDTLEYTQDKPPRWVWLAEPAQGENTPISTLGDVSLEKPGFLEIEVNSAHRADKAKQLFGELLTECVGQALVVHETVDKRLENAKGQSIETTFIPGNADQPPDQVAMMQQIMDQHYRKILDNAIPMLDNHTPRQCAADETLRPKVVRWLKMLEQSNHEQAANNHLPAAYDSRWIWKELEIDRDKYVSQLDE